MSAVFRCTSCALTFETPESQRLHYKDDLHRYNLKRRTADLGPVTNEEFLQRKAAAQSVVQEKSAFHAKCTLCKKAFSSSSMLEQHMQSKKHQLMSSKSPPHPSTVSEEPKAKLEVPAEMDVAPEKEREEEGEGGNMVEDKSKDMLEEEEEKEDEEEEEEEEEQEDVPAAILEPEVCIFCNHVSRSVDSNVVHMLKSHGFFIPDAEYLQDLQGLVGYCGEKVKLGKICLYCNGKGKGFHRYSDVQRHMMDKSHCKLLYQEGEDLEEFEDFYDFSSSYDVEGPEEGDEDMDIDSEDEDLVSKTLKVSEIGELVLLDGRVAGHRQYRRYYRQQYRPEDSREAVQAFKAETFSRSTALTVRPGTEKLQMITDKAMGRMHPKALKATLKAIYVARRAGERVRLRTEINANRFGKKPNTEG